MILKRGSVDSDIKNIFVNLLKNNSIEWNMLDNPINSIDCKPQTLGFMHVVYAAINKPYNTRYINLFNILIRHITKKENIKYEFINRCWMNLLLNNPTTEEERINGIHADYLLSKDYLSILYYVNDSDGDTIIYDDDNNIIDSETPISGNYIIYSSSTKHAATPPIINKKRIVINIVLKVENTTLLSKI